MSEDAAGTLYLISGAGVGFLMLNGKPNRATRRATGQSRALPSIPLIKDVQTGATSAMKEINIRSATLFRDHPLPNNEGDALRYLVATEKVTKQAMTKAEQSIVRYTREPELIQSLRQKQEVKNVLITFLANRRRLEILDVVLAEKGTYVEKAALFQKELINSLPAMFAGYIFTPVKEQYGRDDAFAVLAGLLLTRMRVFPSIRQAIVDMSAPGIGNPLLYATLLAVAEGKPDSAGVGQFHTVFAEARISLNAFRNEQSTAITDSVITDSQAVDISSDPERLMLAEFEKQETARLHDERIQFLNLLTKPQRTALLLSGQGYARREIAEYMELGEETAKTHLSVAKKHLRNWMERGELPRGKKL